MDYQKLISDFNNLLIRIHTVYETERDKLFPDRNDLKDFFDSQKELIERLNKRGWVYPMIAPAGMPKEWITALDTPNLDSIVFSFYLWKEGDNFNKIKDGIREKISHDKFQWMREAFDLYERGYFTSCAMILYAIIENSLFKLVSSGQPINKYEVNKPTLMARKAITNMADTLSSNPESAKPSGSIFFLSHMSIMSLSHFILINYGPVADFQVDPEPEMLNRHWLAHGMMKRNVTAIECMKLFVGLETILRMFKEYFGLGHR